MGIGKWISSATGTDHSARQNAANSMALQKQNQAWQTEMANTAHQREVQDLKAAGLNPVLSAGGSGANTGTPGGGSVSGTPAGDPMAMIGNIVNSIATIQQTENNTAKTNADIQNETELTQAQVAKYLAEAGYKEHEINYYLDNGYFPGQTKTKTTNVSGPFGFGTGTSETVPATNKNNIKIPNSAKENEKKNKSVEQKRIQRLKEIGYRN